MEHLVLGELSAHFDPNRTHYWRDKQHHEVDFVIEIGRRRELLAVECKSSPSKFDPAALLAFRRRYPRGENVVVTVKQTEPELRRYGDVEVQFMPFARFAPWLDIRARSAPSRAR